MNTLRIGRSCQVAGAVLIVVAIFLLGDMLTKLPRNLPKAQSITCVNNLKQIGLSFRTWAIDNDGQFPFNVSTNKGGTMEFCAVGSDGFDSNAALHVLVMSNELSTPKLLVCPKDLSRKPAAGFHNLQASNVTYRVRSGTNLSENIPAEVLVVCPIDGNTLLCDGSVRAGKIDREPPWSAMLDLVRYKYLNRVSRPAVTIMVIAFVLLWVGSRLTWEAKGFPKPMGVIIGEALLVVVVLFLIGLMVVGTAPF